MIPFIQPDLTEVEAQAAYDVIMSGFVNEGKLSEKFAEEFAKQVGAKYAIPTTSCTSALALSLMALEIRGKEVIVPDVTMIGTAMAVVQSGNTPVIVDVKPEDGCIDSDQVRKAITRQTAAIIPVHLNGRNAIDSRLLQIANDYQLAIVEDAACCLGSLFKNDPTIQLGTTGMAGCFSLAATKIVVSGQGGVVVTNDGNLYEKITRLKDWGRFKDKSTNHPYPGFNFKFTDIQAAIALKQLQRLPQLVARKQQIYLRYRTRLNDLMFTKEDHPGFCVFYVDIKGQHLAEPLRENGIEAGIIWPALHQQGAVGVSCSDAQYPNAAAMVKEVLWLPSSTKLDDDKVDHICDVILASVV